MESFCKCPQCGSYSLMSGKYADYCEKCKYHYVHYEDENETNAEKEQE